MRTRPSPSITTHPKVHHGTRKHSCTLLRRTALLIAGGTKLPSVPRSTDPHSPDITVSSVILAAYMAVDITDDNNFVSDLDQHAKVEMMTMVQTACIMIMQQKLVIDSITLIWCWGILLMRLRKWISGLHSVVWGTLPIRPWCKEFAPTTTCSATAIFFHNFTNTIFASTQSRHSIKRVQIFSSNFGWSSPNSHADQRSSTCSSIPHVSTWGCPSTHGYGWLKGTDPLQVLLESSRCLLQAKDHRTLLPLAECSRERERERSRNLRKGLVGSYSSPTCPKDFGMIA